MLDKIKHIAQVISELPTHKAPGNIWNKIVGELDQEQGIDHLHKAIEDYNSGLKAPDFIWENFERDLDQLKLDEILSRAIDELPTQAAPDLFDQIAPRQAKQVSFNQKLAWLTGVAASFLLLIGTYFFYQTDEVVLLASYTEESNESNAIIKAAIDQLGEDDEILEVIEVHCAQIAIQCESPEFKGLFDYYLELDASKDELIAVMNDNQEQVQLVDYLVRVEKEKNEVGKQLIQMIIG